MTAMVIQENPLSGGSDELPQSAHDLKDVQDQAILPSGTLPASPCRLPHIASPPAHSPCAKFVQQIPIAFARQHAVFAVEGANGQACIVVPDTTCLDIAETVRRLVDGTAEFALAPKPEILAAINAAYQQQTGQTEALLEHFDAGELLSEIGALTAREDLLDSSARAPVVKLVNLLFFEAIQARASDIHIQPYEQRLIARMRIDGVLHDMFELPKTVQEEVVSRIKIMGRMNIAEKLVAQDGRATVQVGEKQVDLRIASLPTSFGERVVIRLLDKSARLFSLSEIGMDSNTVEAFRTLVASEHGIVLVTGPTGSGKTTTLYAAIQEINSTAKNILTLEDPIEYGLEGISQTQVSDRKGMTFAGGLRSVLRQDPDIIMVGEIRDRETAVMAIQSALTGHLVFSTLHTNDAASAIARLLDLGIEPYLLASSLIGVLAQRLVRRVCPACSQGYRPSPLECERLKMPGDIDGSSIRMGRGCAACRSTGFRGRLGIFELMRVDDMLRKDIQRRASASDIQITAARGGMSTMRDDGIRKILAGQTTIGEVLRVTMPAGD